jgi:hypothetical protein
LNQSIGFLIALKFYCALVNCAFSMDKALHHASGVTTPPSERQLYQEFLKHARGQLCLHFATLVLKKAKKVIFWNSVLLQISLSVHFSVVIILALITYCS